MQVDYETKIHFSGSDEERSAFLRVLSLYTNRKHSGAYFSLFDIDDIIKQESNTFDIVTGGPWGSYGELNDVGLFREIAEAAPNAEFKGMIAGNGTYDEQSLKAVLKDQKLYIETTFFSYEEIDDGYTFYLQKKLPFKKFVQLFKIEDEEFDQDTYYDCLSEMLNFEEDKPLHEFTFEDFCDAFGDDLFDEETFNDAFEEISKLNVKSVSEYREDGENDTTSRYIYDPVAKEYAKGNPIPGGVFDVTDLFKEQLEKQGSDKDPGDLTIEEAYDLFAAAMDDDEEDELSEETTELFDKLFSDEFFYSI